MKRLISIVLILVLLLPAAAISETLRSVQDYILYHAPNDINHSVTLTGEIKEIYHIRNYHWGLVVSVDEEKAITPMDRDYPYFVAEFSLIDEEIPYAVGDIITVYGDINPLYSSVIIPQINSKTINGEKVY